MDTQVIQMPKHLCPYCKKNESTQLCDFVIDYFWTSAKDERGRMIGLDKETCNNQMCKTCANDVSGHEFCPTCNELYKYVQKNHEKAKGNLYHDTLFGRV